MRASRRINKSYARLISYAIAFVHVTKHVREWLELDDRLEKILTAHVYTAVDSASVPCWRTMRDKDVDVIGDQIPLFL